MKKIITMMAFLSASSLFAGPANYGTALCAYPQFECVKTTSGQTWDNMFPDEVARDIVQKLNRTYNNLWAGKTIAVPKDLKNKTLLDFSPFPLHIKKEGEKQIIVDQDKLAFGAYDAEGNLVTWGPVSSGSDKCSDSARSCRTMTGIFRVFSKENEKCRSNIFPIGKGGAKMPYCMYFHKGFALHGSDDIPGYRASHGCVRMFTRDALWLNHVFADSSSQKNNFVGTKVTVRPVMVSEKK